MKEHRRHLPKAVSPLEMLDDRIVPSAIAFAPMRHAALVGHVSAHDAVHARVHHVHRPAHHVHAAPQVSSQPVVTNAASVGVQSSVSAPASSPTPAPVTISGGGGRAILPPVSAPTATATATPAATTTDIGDIKNGPLAKAGQDLITIYQEFVKQGSSATFTSSKAGVIRFQGTNVGIDAHASGNFSSLVTAMTNLGMKVQTQDATHGIVEGYLPISQLPAAAQNTQVLSLSAIYIPRPSTM